MKTILCPNFAPYRRRVCSALQALGLANPPARLFHSRRSRRRQSALISEEKKLAPTDVGGYTLRPFLAKCEIFGLGRRGLAVVAALAVMVPLSGSSADLSGVFAPVANGTVINLSAEGNLDWAQWGLVATNIFNRKNGVTAQISDVSLIGANGFAQYTTNLLGYTWTNGTPVPNATNTTTGLAVTGMSNGFAITVLAGTTEERLKVYVGVTAAQGQFQATLSDLSAPDFIDNSLDSPGETINGVYTIHFAAASINQALTVTFTTAAVYDPSLGNITLQAAALATNLPPSVALTNPVNNALFFAGQDILLGADASDRDGMVTNVEFFAASFSLGQATNSPYSITWSNVAAGNYSLTARATDDEGATTVSAPVNVRVSTNTPPTVAITSPLDESAFVAPASIIIIAVATDTNGSVSKVEFFQGSTKLGETTNSNNSTYSLTWSNVMAGNYTLTTKATDNQGATTISSPVTVVVTTTGGRLTGSMAAVAQGSVVDLASEGVADWAHWGLVTENSFDHKAGVVSLVSNYSVIGAEPAYPYADNFNGYTWTNGTPTATATNTTTGVYVVGLGDGFQVTAPADTPSKTLKLYVGTYGARGKLLAFLSDFTAPTYQDTSLDNAGNGSGAVYAFSYLAASAGQTIIVRFKVSNMHDSSYGNVTLQAATLVTGNKPPFAAIRTPTNSSVFLYPANITIAAAATDSDGTISKIEFFDGATRLGQVTSSLSPFTWTNAALGGHSLTARATDNGGVTFTSEPIKLFVTRGGGFLSGSVNTPSPQEGLSAEGRTDWAHWGLNTANSFDHRRLTPQRINNFARIGAGPGKRLTDNATGFTWTNGTPTLSATDTATGVYLYGLSNGFQITVAADTVQRRLNLYLGLYGAQGDLEVSLSDLSAASYTDTSLAGVYNNAYAEYTIDFAAASTNQSLLVQYTSGALYDLQYGNVTLEAATLALPSFYLRNLLRGANTFRFSFPTEPGAIYNVLYSDLLSATNWLCLMSLTGSGGEIFVTNSAPPIGQRWYRVQSQ